MKGFNKDNKKKKVIISILIITLVGLVLVQSSYAFFQRQTEVRFINAKVRFPKASEVTYTTTSNTSVKNVEQALNDLYGKLGK